MFLRASRSLLLTSLLLLITASATLAGPWWNAEWTLRKRITIDTTDKGYAIGNPIGTTAVLVRLKDANFIPDLPSDGSGLRFLADDDKTLLSYHVDTWDETMQEASVWVKIPDLKPDVATHIWLYYGNSKPPEKKFEPKATYDADTTLVYHFSENNTPALDSSSNQIVPDKGGAIALGAIIGNGLRLPAPTPISIDNPALQWTAGGALTWSAWVKPTALKANAALFSRHEGTNGFVIGENSGLPFVEVTTGGAKQTAAGTTPLVVNVWAHLAVIANGPAITLYVNGVAAGTVATALPALAGPCILGRDEASPAAFTGEIDEMQISKVAREVGSIKLAAISQALTPEAAKLITQGAAESGTPAEHESEISKHIKLFGDISKDLTPDGVIVIFGCIILAVVGWAVGVQKFLYLNKISKASKVFLKRWEGLSSDLTALDHGSEDGAKSLGGSGGEQKIMRQSPLFHIYHIGSQEIQKRIDDPKQKFDGLSGRSIEAIRATLDGGHVREVQRLNSKLVFLTIGIAGGPYLGLLGTVIGVMITFAVIAQSGEVEINSIAPGIAGALLATVAGLAVAIPALFLYSYLSSRIKEAVNGMEIFIDEFVARIAEAYPSSKE
jgi:biopolymer transport protein ExbB